MNALPPPLRERVPGPELMDDIAGIGGVELIETLRELRVVNRRLGGHRTTLGALDDLAGRRPHAFERGEVSFLDVGGGSGDAAPVIRDWATRRGLVARVTVLDVHPETAAEARRVLAGEPGIDVVCGDLFAAPAASVDVVHAGLFLHHFDGPDAARALAAMARIARVGVVVNDLQRRALPWLLIRGLTALFSRNRLIRADAPHSVARGFRDDDWRRLAADADLDLRWRRSWAWRWAVSGVISGQAT